MSGQLPIDIVVRMESALRDLEKFRKEGTRAATAVGSSFASQDQLVKRALSTVMSFNASRAVFAGVTASVGLATKGMREWAKTSVEAADSLDKLQGSWSSLINRIGQDVDESGILKVLAKGIDSGNESRDRNAAKYNSDGQIASTLFKTQMGLGPFGFISDELLVDPKAAEERYRNLQLTRIRESEIAKRPEIIRQRDAERIAAMRARGDDLGVAQSEYDAAISQIGANRAAIRPGAENARELNSLYDTQEETARNKLIAVQDRILKGQMAEEESARRTAEAAMEKAEAERKTEAAKVRTAKHSEQEYEFTLRQLMIENQRREGDEEGAKIAETRLQFDRQRFNIATDESIGTSARNSLIRRTDAIEAGALSALSGGTVSPIQRSYQAPGFLSSGTYAQGLLASAFAPAGASKPVEQAQLDELRKIRLAVEGGGATFN